MTSKVTIHRLPTGVPGLDQVLGGGLPEFSFNLIAGQPGCGKTTLAHQIMFSLATPQRPAIYFTVLGEPPMKMLRYQQQFEFFDNDSVNESVRFINLSEDAASGDLDRVLARIVEAVTAHEPGLVFVDSFRSVMIASETNGDAQSPTHRLQQFVQQLGMMMTSWQATTFLIGEYFVETDANPVFTVADGLIWLRQSVLRNSMVRKLEILKMRGQPTLPGLHTFRIGAAGIKIFAPPSLPSLPDMARELDAVAEQAVPASATRLQLGVPELDKMLGGGLPRGYSLLVAGPSGSGKSILAAAFLAEGARCGETGVLAVFEQRSKQSQNRVIAGLAASGQVSVVDSRATDLSIDEVIILLQSEIERTGATRVVIDSLTSLELAVAPTFREGFRETLARLELAMAGAGVTLLMTSELEDRYTDLRFSPYGTAFLTDAIIVQRYIEIDSRLRRMLAVVKVRASAHSDELREFHIDNTGIHVGATLPDQEGLLGGRPRQKGRTA
ncbi:ATPase domain-containing protein [Roseateles sp.]|uniref:ATPase domain-containing protein n=1 Tax=Roseateles sp. TaxID=1971397 RepID=UPI00286B7E91|nr:ATPase domain-containing protein [Roseateles sp.]